MLVDSFDPLGNLYLSSVVAAIPIILFLTLLTVMKVKGINASWITLVVTTLIAMLVFNLNLEQTSGSILQGVIIGLFPIGYIITMAIWLYKVTLESGKFDIIQDSIIQITADQRVQFLLIGFCLNAFLEGAAGFGVPIAICAVLLVQLGFKPLEAAMLCLIANGSSGAFGAIGIPVAIVDTFNLEGISALEVSQMSALTLPIINFVIPALLIFIIDGFKGIKETLPAILTASIIFTISQVVITVFMGPELADIFPSLFAMIGIAILSRFWQPKNTFRLSDEEIETKAHPIGTIAKAWSPFILLTVLILIWSVPQIADLLAKSTVTIPLPGGLESPINLIGATGTALLLAVIITILTSPTVSIGEGFNLLMKSIKELWIPILTISLILAIAKVTTYSGMIAALGQVASKTGAIFPLLSPVLGWIGVFMTGSVVNNNTLFAGIQATAASNMGVNGNLLVAANTVGGSIGKLISPQSIAIATAAVNKTGEESALLKMTMKYSIALLIFLCIWTFALTMFM
ncbi:L-lactate permease [Abyssicoccus albus]|uniref:L-lactate permease n=1 Tax=Abyssicoccus albus TaxID=1817405 RepID=A0A3N5BG64_9BACL|nr:L-lactate permease [Abyssicoccus albus]RPF56507.1 lactate permease [Abyssicoccus albus]